MSRPPDGPAIALVPWGLEFEDFLDRQGLSLDEFFRRTTGSWILTLPEALRRGGMRPFLLVFVRDPSAPRSIVRDDGLEVVLLPTPRLYRRLRHLVHPYGTTSLARRPGSGLLGIARVALSEALPYLATPLRATAAELRRRKCNAILHQEYESARFDLLVRSRRRLRALLLGYYTGASTRGRLEPLLRPRTMRAADGFLIAPAEEVARVRSRYDVPDARILRLMLPVDTTRWRPASDAERGDAREALGLPATASVIAWHGRVVIAKKGLDVLGDAFGRLRAARQDLDPRLLLVGTGPDDAKLDGLLEPHADAVVRVRGFLDGVEELRRPLLAADVYAFPSRHEGQALAPVEAMACGLPVVAAAASGVEETVGTDGEAGVVVGVEDAEALAAGLERLLSDPGERAARGAGARARVERLYSYEAAAAELGAFLERLASA